MARISSLALTLLVLLPWLAAAGFRPYDPVRDKNVELLRRESSYEIDYVLENEDGEIIGYSGEADASIDAGNATDFSERRSPLQKRTGEQCGPSYTRTNGQTIANLWNCVTIINNEFSTLSAVGRVWRVQPKKKRIWTSTSNYNPVTGSLQYCHIAIYNPNDCRYYDATSSVMSTKSNELWHGCGLLNWGGVIPVDNWGSACISMGGLGYNPDTCNFQ
ncbi:MAG: hypothetical protein M1813_007520 [Trichoglossum hirsutum]|jgi:hypothetical protein|nr:MAG: hypothetical protein M1813_007520 [Trichoglossum hirsutum]